jgi:signal transduction histidine kinase
VQRVQAWSRRHPWAADTALAVVPFTLGALTGPVPSTSTALAAVVCAPLVWRRRFPVAVLAWVYAIGVFQLFFGPRARMSDLAVIIALYTVSAYGPRWAVAVGLSGGVLGGVLAVLRWSHQKEATYVLGGMVAVVTPVILAWAIGANVRTRRAYLHELEERAVRLERERDARARAAVAEEHERIARELHDVVAHSVGVIVVQADGADAALADHDLAEVATALRAIGRTGRSALSELRLLLGVLRDVDGPGGSGDGPQPGQDQIKELVERVPLPTRLETHGVPAGLPPGLGLAVYRIIQEALTNTIRHAGPDASAVVRLACADRTLTIEVEDDGRGPSPPEADPVGGGHGLVGMRERAAMFGGTLWTGARPGGGFAVRARLPVEARLEARPE